MSSALSFRCACIGGLLFDATSRLSLSLILPSKPTAISLLYPCEVHFPPIIFLGSICSRRSGFGTPSGQYLLASGLTFWLLFQRMDQKACSADASCSKGRAGTFMGECDFALCQ
ncbi:hypothetical protein BDZ45DRAFT_673066 [Acephala macrosclerotiorum]|nr:hypothetical protein BDZ45DRAFT_673066 [Acephala macrosclerotiorum]